ncbi:synaptonemal complex central element protein 2 [Hyla sarda]|uniref:synaptonemal complex central element protein 2 n=1 Tax=Hyla sarda TaxID=327740 RepID=UPI0024C41641|nr:synaptonemal complex central element protein 2 [Hyla sarda]XP_056426430.1 synaptonemal complex central element protein 2 [Hyla sarda]
MADSELEHREVLDESANSNTIRAERAGPSNSQTSSSKSGSSLSSPGPDAATTSSTNEGKTFNYFASLDANVEALQSRAQCLIDKINEGRSMDQTLMKNFNTNLNIKVAELSQCLEDRMYQMYEENNTQLQVRLQELTDIIERIGQLQAELKQVCQTVVTVYKDLGLQHDS